MSPPHAAPAQQQAQQVQQAQAPTAVSMQVGAALAAQVKGGLKGNWPAFWTAVGRDHCHAGLIWNEATRGNLREALHQEAAALRARRTRVAQVGFGGGGCSRV